MLMFSIILAAIVFGFYFMRKKLARWSYTLRTGNKNPDWAALEKNWWGEAK